MPPDKDPPKTDWFWFDQLKGHLKSRIHYAQNHSDAYMTCRLDNWTCDELATWLEYTSISLYNRVAERMEWQEDPEKRHLLDQTHFNEIGREVMFWGRLLRELTNRGNCEDQVKALEPLDKKVKQFIEKQSIRVPQNMPIDPPQRVEPRQRPIRFPDSLESPLQSDPVAEVILAVTAWSFGPAMVEGAINGMLGRGSQCPTGEPVGIPKPDPVGPVRPPVSVVPEKVPVGR
jgi:hypothetical protein